MPYIYKYPLTGDFTELELPKGAKILYVNAQRDVPTIWAMVDISAEKELRRILIAGTGAGVDTDGCVYIGSFLAFKGQFVGHVFEVTKK